MKQKKQTGQVEKKNADFDARICKYAEGEAALLKSLHLSKRLVLNFKAKKAGFWARIALSYLQAYGAILDVQFFNLKK